MTKYPIILVHGVLVKDYKRFKAFGKIEKVLNDAGYIVYTSKTDGFGTTETNGVQLQKQIYEVMKIHNVDKVNLIGHSKGGLDSRYVVENLGMGKHVASITTVCTPHKGSPVASILLKMPKFMKKIISKTINFWSKKSGDEFPNSLAVCEELKLSDDDFTKLLPFNVTDEVYCQSYSASMNKSYDDFLLTVPHLFSVKYENKLSDGLVSKDSMIFGDYKGDAVNESMSHAQIIDFMVNKKKKEKVYGFYLQICEDLKNKGL